MLGRQNFVNRLGETFGLSKSSGLKQPPTQKCRGFRLAKKYPIAAMNTNLGTVCFKKRMADHDFTQDQGPDKLWKYMINYSTIYRYKRLPLLVLRKFLVQTSCHCWWFCQGTEYQKMSPKMLWSRWLVTCLLVGRVVFFSGRHGRIILFCPWVIAQPTGLG